MKMAAAVVLLTATTLYGGGDVRCRSRVTFDAAHLSVTMPFERTKNGVFVRVRANKNPDPLWFVIDSGSPRTLISEAAAKRTLINEMTRTDAVLSFDSVKVDRTDLRITNLAPLSKAWGRTVDGVIGYELLCRTVVSIDYDAQRVTIAHPAVFKYEGMGETLPLTIRNGWSFVEGTIKVTGRPAVIDNFFVDSGSRDAVNHPIIRESKGPVRTMNAGVVGPNEWFQLGHYTIGSTQSACCGAEGDSSQHIGADVLSRFRVTFDYPHKRLIVARDAR
ncbi:MAG TPA: hypothetical protein VLU46_06190 [Thermoanaerobaculia bacterium]|nr:hypothetical protein [Thermoanaerobaculia bacterium]